MKKLTFIIIAMFMMTFASQAQHIFNKGDIGVNAGIGIGGWAGLFPSLEASVEYGAIPTGDIGLVSFGGVAGWKYSSHSYNYNWYTGEDYHFNQFIFGVRGTWHLHTFTSDKWDVYAGLGAGMRIYTDNDYIWNSNTGEYDQVTDARSSFYEEVFIGGRMMINPDFGLFAEVGYSKLSNIRFGLTFLM